MFSGFFKFGRGAGIVYPPVSDELLVWLRGSDGGDTQKLDSWRKPDAENFDMSQSYCISLNGTDEFGETSIIPSLPLILECDFVANNTTDRILIGSQDTNRTYLSISTGVLTGGIGSQNWATIKGTTPITLGVYYTARIEVSIGGDITLYLNDVLEYSGTMVGALSALPLYIGGSNVDSVPSYHFDGEILNSRLINSTQDIHFRIAEGSGLTSFDDTGDHSIAWTGVEVDLWAQRQDNYHGNAIDGWWEKSPETVKYPYAVSGFTEFHRGGTFNDAETSFAPESFTVGYMSVGDVMNLSPLDVPDDGQVSNDGTCTLVLDTVNNKITCTVAGVVRDIEITGTLEDGEEVTFGGEEVTFGGDTDVTF